jgi:hypothetical protein
MHANYVLIDYTLVKDQLEGELNLTHEVRQRRDSSGKRVQTSSPPEVWTKMPGSGWLSSHDSTH